MLSGMLLIYRLCITCFSRCLVTPLQRKMSFYFLCSNLQYRFIAIQAVMLCGTARNPSFSGTQTLESSLLLPRRRCSISRTVAASAPLCLRQKYRLVQRKTRRPNGPLGRVCTILPTPMARTVMTSFKHLRRNLFRVLRMKILLII